MFKLEFYLNRIIKYGLYAILLTPLAFWPRALYAFGTPKFILFQVLVEIVFAAWLILKLLKSDFFRSPPSQLRGGLQIPKLDFKNYLFLALSGFMAASFLSAIFGIDFSRSFWGIGARMTGLFAELHFFAWFLVLIDTFRSGSMLIKADQRGNGNYPRESEKNPHIFASTYINFSFFVALAVAATAFYQNTQLTMAWGSTVFNNPTFAAPYLMFHFFWGLYKTIFNFQFSIFKLKGWIYGAGSALIFFVVLLGKIRGAILGLFAGILLLGFFFIFSDAVSRRFKIALAAAFALIFIGFFNLWIFKDSQFIQNQNVTILKRLTQFSLSEATAQTRFLAWQTALKGFTDRPILGAGPENFNYLFNVHYNPSFLKFGGGGFGETWFDKPHNAFLEILTETGVVGGLFYLLIWLAAVLTLFKLFKNGQKILTFILAGAFTAYLGSVFFAFDSFGSWFGLYLFLAFLANSDTNTRIHTNDTNIYSYICAPFVIGVTIFVIFLVYVNYSILRANIADADALRIFPHNSAQSMVLFKKSLTYFSPYKSEYQFDLIASVAGAVEKGVPLPDLEDTVNFALGEADKAVAAHLKDAAKYTDMVRIYNILGTKGRDPEILAQAEAFGNKSLELSPQRQETLFYLARTALLKNDTISAVILAKQAVSADPDARQSHWYLGLAYIVNNQKQEGIAEIKKAIEMGYKPQNQAEADFIKSLGL